MRALERAELLAHEYVRLGNVRVEQRKARSTDRGVRRCMVEWLVKRCDTGATTNQRDVLEFVLCYKGLVFLRTPVCGEVRTFVREPRDRAFDGERGTWLEPLVHVLAQHAALVFFDEEHALSLVPWARNGCIWADNRITLLVERRAVGAFGCAHDDEREVTGESAAPPSSGSSKMKREDMPC